MSYGWSASCQIHDSGNGAGTLLGDPSSLPAEYPRKSLNGVPRQTLAQITPGIAGLSAESQGAAWGPRESPQTW